MNGSEKSNPSFKWPVAATRQIKAPPEKIWAVISSPGNLAHCHPFCENNPVEKWPGKGSLDSVYYYSGWVYHRLFTEWFDGVGYDLEIGRKKGRKSRVSWRIHKINDSEGELTITVFPQGLQQLSVFLRWLPHFAYLRPRLRSYLISVVKGFEWYITTGQPVKRNQFGAHKWFSPDPNHTATVQR
jgi:hypothetical protein